MASKAAAPAPTSAATLSFAQAQDHCNRIIAEFKSLKYLAEVLDAAVAAESQLAGMQAECAKLIPEVERLKSEIALLSAGHDEKKSALAAEISSLESKRDETLMDSAISTANAEKLHSKRMQELEAEFNTRGDALRVEISSLQTERDASAAALAQAQEDYAAFRRKLVPA